MVEEADGSMQDSDEGGNQMGDIKNMNKEIQKTQNKLKRNIKSFNFTPEQFNSLVNIMNQQWPSPL